MKKVFLSIVCALTLVSSVVSQITVHGVTFPAKLGKEDKLFVLNGAGVRNKYFMNVYVLGLYLPTKNSNPIEIVDANAPLGVRMQIISSLVTQDRMAESMVEGFQKSTGGKMGPLQKDIDKVVKIFKSEPIKVGDVFDIFYFPGKGIRATKNNKPIDIPSGLAFKKAIYGIWLGPDPVDDPLKDKLLGLQ